MVKNLFIEDTCWRFTLELHTTYVTENEEDYF